MVAIDHDLPPMAPPATVADAIPLAARRRGVAPRQVFAVTLIGTVVLAVFAAGDLPSWVERLGDGRLAAPIRTLCVAWDADMARLGLTRPHQALRRATTRLLDQPWPTGG